MTHTLSEAESKELLAGFGLPIAREVVAADPDAAVVAATGIGFPVVAKLCGDRIAHKSERGLVRLHLGDAESVRAAAADLLAAATPEDGDVAVLVAPMVRGNRELIAGLSRDPQFGMTVMVGVGGVLTEALADVAIRLVPLTAQDALDMLDDLGSQALLGSVRGEPPLDRGAMSDALVALSRVAEARPDVVSVDLNPLVIAAGRPVAVDALVELDGER